MDVRACGMHPGMGEGSLAVPMWLPRQYPDGEYSGSLSNPPLEQDSL